MIKFFFECVIVVYMLREEFFEEWKFDGFVEFVNMIYFDEGVFEKSDIFGKELDEMYEFIMDCIMMKYNEKEVKFGEE